LNALGKITLPLLLLAALMLVIIFPFAAADDWGDPPENENGDGELDGGENIWIPLDEPMDPNDMDEDPFDAGMNVVDSIEYIANEDPDWLNGPNGVDNEGTMLQEDVDYEVTLTYDWEGNVTGVNIEGVEEEEEFDFEEIENWEPPEPPSPNWWCTPSDGENMDRRNNAGQTQDCGTTSGWSAWSCSDATHKERTRQRRGCTEGHCYVSTEPNTVHCPYGCSGGQCQPHADFTVTTLSETGTDKTLELDGSNAKDPYSGDKLTYAWNYSTGETDTGKTATRTFPKSGSLQITLTVTTAGLTSATQAPDNGTTDYAAAGGPTIVINAEQTPLPMTPATLNATGTTDDKDTPKQLKYEWDYESDGTIDDTFDSTISATPQNEPGTHTYTSAGQTLVGLTVTDTDGLFSTTSVLVDVQNQNPIVDFECLPTGGLVPLTVNCTNNSYDPDVGQTIDHEWIFEPGQIPITTQNATHAYIIEGTKTITLTVRDPYGGFATDTQSINVTHPSAITFLAVSNPATKTDPAFISFTCNKDTYIKFSFFDNENNTALSDKTFNCTKTPSLTQAIFPESAVYKIVATVTTTLNGPDDLECDNCPKTIYTVVGREIKDLETPETTLVLIAGIAFAVIAIISGKH